MPLQIWLTIVAIVTGPIVAVLITLYAQKRRERRSYKERILGALMMDRGNMTARDTVRALNMIDLVFYGNKQVRNIWRDYYDICNERPVNAQRAKEKSLELIKAIADDIGYKDLSHLDIQRYYYPTATLREDLATQAHQDMLLRQAGVAQAQVEDTNGET